MDNNEKLIKTIPKAELHCHIEGTLEPEMMFELAQRNNIKLAYTTPTAIRNAYEFHDLQSFLNIYYQGAAVLQTEQDFYDLTFAYLKRAHEDNVLHTEIFFDPQTHTERGIAFNIVVEGISRALETAKHEFGMSSHLIMCFLRHLSQEAAFQTLDHALKFKNHIIGIGLDSSEQSNPPQKFQAVFKAAQDAGFLCVAHAGEEGSAQNIWDALTLLNVKRIDHGIRCTEDEKLVRYLKEKQIPLTVCPLSNIKLRVFDNIKQHNLKTLLDQGLCVSINSDDPAYFGGYITDNYLACYKHLNLKTHDIIQLATNSFNASFLTPEKKQYYLNKIHSI